MNSEDLYHISSLPPILDSYKSAQCPEKVCVTNSMHYNVQNKTLLRRSFTQITNEPGKGNVSSFSMCVLLFCHQWTKITIYIYILDTSSYNTKIFNKSAFIFKIFYIFICMHLADTFIQSDFRLYIILSVCVFPGNRTHNLCAANTML